MTANLKMKAITKKEILPVCVNLVDYLEITDKFWEVAEWLRLIHDKLTKG
jgi:hypothetical protein